jgi:hypothetical protein
MLKESVVKVTFKDWRPEGGLVNQHEEEYLQPSSAFEHLTQFQIRLVI